MWSGKKHLVRFWGRTFWLDYIIKGALVSARKIMIGGLTANIA